MKLEDACNNFAFDLKIVTQSGVTINPIDMTIRGTLPWPVMYEAMTKAITVLWRGGEMATEAGRRDLAGEIRELVKVRLSKHKYPRWIVFVDELPRNDRGKVDKKALGEREARGDHAPE